MADEVQLNTFTVTLLKQPAVPGTGSGVALKKATYEEAYRAFGLDLPPSLPGGLSRVDIVMGSESQPVLVVDYGSEGRMNHSSLAYILIPANVYEPAPDGRLRYMVIADSIERKLLGGTMVVAMAYQDQRSLNQPGGVTAIWEKEGLLALAATAGMKMNDLEAAVLQIA